MKKMWPVFVVLLLMGVFLWVAGTAAIAQDQCEVVGNSYVAVSGGEEYTLTFIEEGPQFSPAPRCAGSVTFEDAYGGSQSYPWLVTSSGLTIAGLTIAGLKAVLSGDGLTVYVIPSDMHRLRIGDTVYMTEEEVPSILFIE